MDGPLFYSTYGIIICMEVTACETSEGVHGDGTVGGPGGLLHYSVYVYLSVANVVRRTYGIEKNVGCA